MASNNGYRQVASGVRGHYSIEGLEADKAYEIVVVPRSKRLNATRGPQYGSKAVVHPKGQRDQPAAPTNLRGSVNDGFLTLSWDGVSDRDISWYEVRVGDAWWGAQILRTDIDVTFLSMPCFWTGTANVMVRAFNRSGVYSQFYASTQVTSPLTADYSLDSGPSWAGTLSNLTSGGSPAELTVTDPTAAASYTTTSLSADGGSYHIMVYANVGVVPVPLVLDQANFLLDSDKAVNTVLDDLDYMDGTDNRDLYELDKHNYTLDNWLANTTLLRPANLLDAVALYIEMNVDGGGWELYAPVYRAVTSIAVRVTLTTAFEGVVPIISDLVVSLIADGRVKLDAGGGGGVSDHGALTGLSDDDHTQYLLADATRTVTVGAVPFKIISGASGSSFSVRNSGDSASYLRVTNAGAVYFGTSIGDNAGAGAAITEFETSLSSSATKVPTSSAVTAAITAAADASAFTDPNSHYQADNSSIAGLLEEVGFALKDVTDSWIGRVGFNAMQTWNASATFVSGWGYGRTCVHTGNTTIGFKVLPIPPWATVDGSVELYIDIMWTIASVPGSDQVWEFRAAVKTFDVGDNAPGSSLTSTYYPVDVTTSHVVNTVYRTTFEISGADIYASGDEFLYLALYRNIDATNTYTASISVLGIDVRSGVKAT